MYITHHDGQSSVPANDHDGKPVYRNDDAFAERTSPLHHSERSAMMGFITQSPVLSSNQVG